MIIFLRLRKSPQTPKKKSVKETPKYLKASIGIVYFYAMWLCYPRGNLLYNSTVLYYDGHAMMRCGISPKNVRHVSLTVQHSN